MSALRIALLVSSMGGGGAERVAVTLANAWARIGHNVLLVPTYLAEHRAAYETSGNVIVAPLAASLPDRAASFAKGPSKLRALRKVVSRFAPDVVISFLTNVNVTALAALLGYARPLIISERTSVAASIELSGGLRLARQLLYQFADALVVQTAEAMIGYQRSIFRAPQASVIPNPLPVRLHACSRRAQQPEGGGEIIAMGRLTKEKQFDHVILAFAEAFQQDPGWRLTIWGEGALRSDLEALVARCDLRQRVRLPGTTTRPWKCLLAGQIFALSSAYEGFPNAMLEAMAVGLPCVAYDSPNGPRDLADHGSAAVLVPSGDVASLAVALRKLADEPDRRVELGRLAAESVRERFSETAILGKWDALFEKVRR